MGIFQAMGGDELTAADRDLLAEFRAGKRTALARVITRVENARPGFQAILSELHASLGRAQRIGITGPPGAGKSTLVAALVSVYRERGETVAVVAVDPTSPFTGGALLGDRIRMSEVSLDTGVFIRSMASRGSLGGLAVTTKEVADVLDAFGFDRILIETVGVGQSELDIAAAADSTVVVLVPESGDSVQAMKAGLMEISDLFVVNKADRPGSERLAREIEMALRLRSGGQGMRVPAHHGVDLARVGRARAEDPAARARMSDAAARTEGDERDPRPVPDARAGGAEPPAEPRPWSIPVLRTVAESGEGVPELVGALDAHMAWLSGSGELGRRRRARLAERVREVVLRTLKEWVWLDRGGEAVLEEALPALEAGRETPYELAARIVRAATG
ncbi:MAG TPA: methylmalonyl Co-A mutase-associated GTPase MeaB [Longimicrobiales bacterium]